MTSTEALEIQDKRLTVQLRRCGKSYRDTNLLRISKASRVTSITYKQNGTTVLGNLTYEYDKAGNRTKTGGSWARTGMPEPLATTSYDANNRQLTFGDKTLAYDDNGNLLSITDSNGTTLYSWNARNQLVGSSGRSVNASFVYDGMGRREKKRLAAIAPSFFTTALIRSRKPQDQPCSQTFLRDLSSMSFTPVAKWVPGRLQIL